MKIKNSIISLITIAVLSLASLFPIVTACNYPPYLNDDSYITLTYAKNLAGGHGFVFNHPPATLGTTAPLFALVVAGLAFVFPFLTIQNIAVVLTAFCWLGIVWVFYIFRKEWVLENWQAGIVGLTVIGSGWINSLGMESYLFAFLLVLSLSLFFSRRFLSAGFAMGLLFLTRGEGVLVFCVTLITAMSTQRHKRKLIDRQFIKTILRIAIGFALPAVLWFLYAYFTFGSFLPNTLAAKQMQGQTGFWYSFWQRMVATWMPAWGRNFVIAKFPFINFWWVIIIVGIIGALFKRRRWLIFMVWMFLYISGYILLKVSAYPWYQLPVLFVLNLFFGLGIIEIVDLLLVYIKPRTLSVGTSILLTGFILWILAEPKVDSMLAYKGDARGESYLNLSRWFQEHAKSSESIAFIEIGYLGYFTNNRIVDLGGLVSPDIVPHLAEKDFNWGFWHYHPDYYVYLEYVDWALADIRNDVRFGQQYIPVATLRGPFSMNFVIYKRMDK